MKSHSQTDDAQGSLEHLANSSRPIVWSIAGSDSGGGAGIQADNLTIYDLGCHPCNVVTGITAQNSVEVTQVVATDLELLSSQLDALRVDLPPGAIKIGLLVSHQQIQFIAEWLQVQLPALEAELGRDIPVIWDPVMVASSGDALTDSQDNASMTAYLQLAAQSTLLTPNSRELDALLNIAKQSSSVHLQSRVKLLSGIVGTNVLVTGGDVNSELAQDWLAVHHLAHTSEDYQQQVIGLSSNKQQGVNNHGTGCTMSSAIASCLALGYPMLDAICIAKAYINQGLASSYQLGQGQGPLSREGWPKDLASFPHVILENSETTSSELSFAKVTTPLKVYPVTESLNVLEQVLAAGARTVQLRVKKPNQHLEKKIEAAIALGKSYQAQVFINDHWQLAVKHGAFGVHLGQEDAMVADLEQISKAGLALGLSSHGYFEMLVALAFNPSYLAMGHIFPTPTKNMPSLPQGLHKLKHFVATMQGKVPLVAIGGIDATNMPHVAATGVDDIALVRAVEQADDPGQSWQHLQQQWSSLQ